MDRLDAVQYLLRKFHVDAVDIGLQLFHGGRADDVGGQERPGIHICQRHLRRIEAMLAGQSDIALGGRSEEHTSELQSLMRISYAVFCLKKKKKAIKHFVADT